MTYFLAKIVNIIPWWMRDEIRKIPLVSDFQRILFRKYFSGKSFLYVINGGPAKGLKIPISLPDDKLIWTGTWEKKVAEKIYSNIKKNKSSYDIGSHRGFMAGIMALAGSKIVYCFEPNPGNIKHLNELCHLNRKLRLKLLPYAIAEKSGEAEFSLMPESSMGKLSKSLFQPEVKRNTSIMVQVRALDSLLKEGEIEPPGFIKIDVEGAELRVLEGARKIIKEYSPNFVVELHSFSLADKCQKFLREYGYNVEIIQKEIDFTNESKFKVCHLLAIKT